MKNKRKGFTLIELLITIVIMSLVVVLTFNIIQSAIDKSKVNSNEITFSSIVKSANNYTMEFKNQDKYWFEDTTDDNVEFACTTVQALINKGMLSDSAIGEYKINDKTIEISNDTSIKTIRNKDTKVVSDTVLIDDIACDEVDDVDLKIELPSPDGLDNWYKNNFDITITLNKAFSTGISKYVYEVYDNGNYIPIGQLESPQKNSKYNFKYNGNDISFCVNALSNKDKTKRVCSDRIKVDTKQPTIDSLDIDFEEIYSTSKTIRINSYTERTSGIKEFQYYLTDSATLPDINTESSESLGLNTSKTFNNDMDGTYIYFRGIDNAGNVGNWSSPKRIYIDISKPIITKNGTSFEAKSSDNVEIIDKYFTYDSNGKGKITNKYCYTTSSSKKIYKVNELKVGTYNVTCEVVKENGLKASDSIELIVKQGYSCQIGTLYEKSTDNYICIANASSESWYSTSRECVETTESCTTSSKRVMDCNLCGVLNDTGSKECDACTDACGDNLKCLSNCKSPCQDPCKTCTVTTETCRDVCRSYETIYTYYCKSGWSSYSGSGSSLKCYKSAEMAG